MKKILIISYYWPPSGGAGVQRWVKFARYLQLFGFDPVVLSVDPEYASYPLRDQSLNAEVSNIRIIRTKSLEPYAMYSRLMGKKEIPYAGFSNEDHPGFFQKFSRFVRGNFFIPDSRKGWNRYAVRAASKIIKDENIEMVVTTSPPHSSQLIGLTLKKKFGVRWIADLRDPWTDIYYYPLMYHTWWAKAIDRKLEKQVLMNADELIVVSNRIKALFGKKTGNQSKIHVIPNGYDEADFNKVSRSPKDRFVVSYTGTIAENYGIDTVLKVMARLIHEKGFRHLQLNFVGKVASKYQTMIHQLHLDEFTRFTNHVSHQEAINVMLSSSLLLLAIPKVKDNEGILTGKLFEYLASSKKILAVGPVDGDAAAIIEECNAGKCFNYDDEHAIEGFMQQQLALWASNPDLDRPSGRCQQYSRKNLTRRVAALLLGDSDR